MPFNFEMINDIDNYCKRDLPKEQWYQDCFDFIKDLNLRERIIKEFKNVRYIYKIFEGISADNELLLAEVRLQILMYASIYEAIIHYLLFDEYYKEHESVQKLLIQNANKQISIPEEKRKQLGDLLIHDGKKIIPYYPTTKKRDITKIRFDEKCKAAFQIGLLKEINNPKITLNIQDVDSFVPDFCTELIKLYEIRNAIHIHAEIKKDIEYNLNLSQIAYLRMQPFVEQIKEKLREDGLY